MTNLKKLKINKIINLYKILYIYIIRWLNWKFCDINIVLGMGYDDVYLLQESVGIVCHIRQCIAEPLPTMLNLYIFASIIYIIYIFMHVTWWTYWDEGRENK